MAINDIIEKTNSIYNIEDKKVLHMTIIFALNSAN